MGSIDPAQIDFGIPVSHAEMLVPPIMPPSLGVGLSGFRDTLTLSIGHWPSGIPEESIYRFLESIDDELKTMDARLSV